MPVEQSTVQSKNVEMRRGTLILLIIGAVGLAFLLRSIPQHAPSTSAPHPATPQHPLAFRHPCATGTTCWRWPPWPDRQ
jgi:hypothetical protein